LIYSKNGSYPTKIPNRIILSNGMTRTDSTTFTEQEISDAEYIKVDNSPAVDYPNKLEWDGENLQWIIREPNEEEIAYQWNNIRERCEQLLSETDYKVTKAIELAYINGTTVDQELEPNYVTYRQELRDLCNNVNNDPWNVVWPTKPI